MVQPCRCRSLPNISKCVDTTCLPCPTARHLNGSGAFLHDYGLVDILRICRDVANVSAIASGFAVPSTQCQVDYRTHP